MGEGNRWIWRCAVAMAAGAVAWAARPASAASADEGPFEYPQTTLMKETPRAVIVAFMGDHRTPGESGNWGAWADAGKDGKHHEPDKVGADGKRDIASAYYPAVGPYDMSDPELVEEQCQQIKMTGVDGISFNLSFFEHDPWRQKSMRLYVETMEKYGLKGMVRFENKFFQRVYPDAKEALAHSYADMDSWLKLMEPVQYRISGRPMFMMFTFKMTPEELEAWREKYPAAERPIVVTYSANPAYKGVVEGRFGWTGDAPIKSTDHAPYIKYVDAKQVKQNEVLERKHNIELMQNGTISYFMGGVSPGFDDIGCWGWGNGPRKVERDGGNTYRFRWEQTLKTNLSTVFIPTWNDWCEGTVIEPSVEFGDQYLKLTREYVAKFKHEKEGQGNLMLPVWIYKVRKATKDAAALKDMSAASELIRDRQYGKAEEIVRPWAKKLGVEKVAVWDAGQGQAKK